MCKCQALLALTILKRTHLCCPKGGHLCSCPSLVHDKFVNVAEGYGANLYMGAVKIDTGASFNDLPEVLFKADQGGGGP